MKIEELSEKLGYRRAVFAAIIMVSIGVVIMNTASVPSAGIVLIAVGGLFLISGMARKKREEESRDDKGI